jgi:hypothetical protein
VGHGSLPALTEWMGMPTRDVALAYYDGHARRGDASALPGAPAAPSGTAADAAAAGALAV